MEEDATFRMIADLTKRLVFFAMQAKGLETGGKFIVDELLIPVLVQRQKKSLLARESARNFEPLSERQERLLTEKQQEVGITR